MSESLNAELQHWQARTDDLQVALERVREERDQLRIVVSFCCPYLLIVFCVDFF